MNRQHHTLAVSLCPRFHSRRLYLYLLNINLIFIFRAYIYIHFRPLYLYLLFIFIREAYIYLTEFHVNGLPRVAVTPGHIRKNISDKIFPYGNLFIPIPHRDKIFYLIFMDMKLTNILLEVFDKPYSWNQINNEPDMKRYTFKTESDITYNVYIGEGRHDEWDVIFSARIGGRITISTSNTGDSIRVFATVMDIFKSFLKTTYVKKIIFTASAEDGPSRSRLYTSLVNKYAAGLGFAVSIKNTIGLVTYTLKNKNKPKLNEVFDRPYRFTRTRNVPDRTEYEFTTDAGTKYGVEFFNGTDAGRPNGVVTVTFWAWGKTNPSPGRPEGVPRPEFGKTGGGDSIKVFATVMAIIRKFTSERWVKEIEFNADEVERSRVRLYTNLAKRYAGDIGFRFTEPKETPMGMEFILKNVRPNKK